MRFSAIVIVPGSVCLAFTGYVNFICNVVPLTVRLFPTFFAQELTLVVLLAFAGTARRPFHR